MLLISYLGLSLCKSTPADTYSVQYTCLFAYLGNHILAAARVVSIFFLHTLFAPTIRSCAH